MEKERFLFENVETPTNPPRARALGYKAKTGFVIVRARVRRGGRRKKRHVSKRMPSKQGVLKFKPHKSIQLIAEERAARKFPNLEVLNSYWVGEDGMYKYFEIIFVDPQRPEIQNDNNINWLLTHRRRVHRSLTSAGKKARGIM